MKALAKAVIEAATFLELADDATVDEDFAVHVLEVIASHLQECSRPERDALRQVLDELARGAPREAKRFYGSFMGACGLEDEPEGSTPP